MKNIKFLIIIIFVGIIVGCGANVPPAELINARQAYQQASMGQAAQLAPAELHNAKEALAIAEKSFQDEPKSFRTRDLAYIADRKAKIADVLAATVSEKANTVKANQDFQTTQTDVLKNTKADLATSEQNSLVKTEQIATEKKARLDADSRAAKAQSDLAELAAVKEEERGLVITLSGSVLFASNKSDLLPSAQDRLNHVADALLATKEKNLTVDGFTDSQGSASYNQGLSQRRADAVRTFLISRGYPGELILAEGIGENRPVADNTSAEGRANNRRVEIIVNHSIN
jgi:outer membrane protein OmpA-like peptidoglycan-associated protein